jgi:hypothetical protein
MVVLNRNVYIKSVEGSEIYEHMYRGKEFWGKYVGMLPFSLEEMKLEELGMKTFDSKRFNKTMTNDVINVKFKQKIKSNKEIIKILNKKIADGTIESDKIKLKEHIKELEAKIDWVEIKIDDIEDKSTKEVITKGLRTKLYEEGFTITEIDKETAEVIETKYVVFARSSAKSRTGQVLYIKESLRNAMIKHMRLGMNLEGATDVDFPALLSYESLIGSALEDLIEIPVDNILIVSDIKSIFEIDCNVVAKNADGLLESKLVEDYNMESDIFDGEGLLDSQFFVGDREKKGFILGRQHMFKSALYNCRVQLFLQNYAKKKGIDFDTWELKNTFGETMLAKNVLCIITPNSLKALKFSNKKGSNLKMWRHWKRLIKKENNIFGICKSEKESKRGVDDLGNILNQSSYQMLNSMPYTFADMEQLSKFEVDYIEQLKNDNDTYIKFLSKEANDMNCNEMLVTMYNKNSDISNIKIFKDKRKKDIHNYVTHIKKGKIRLSGDYATILQNGKELLYHSVGALPVDKGILNLQAWKSEMILKGNEAYTTLHEFNKEYVCFRNPHTSPSNVLIIKNTDSEFIRDYFNLSDNIIYTNAIDFPINRILSGQDVDSDNMIIFNNDKILEVARKCYIKSETSSYKVCENGVGKTPNTYKVCNTDMAKIDNKLSQSQKYIGTVVNLGQLYMSRYWDCVNKEDTDEIKLKTLLQGVDICTILSEISIDMAKRLYDIDIKEQITNLKKCEYLYPNKTKNKRKKEIVVKTVPLFFKYVSQNKKIESKTTKYETSMDYLYEILNNIKDAEEISTIEIETLLTDVDTKKVKLRQTNGIVNAINHMSNNIKYIEAFMEGNEDHEKEERYIALDNARNEHMQIVRRYKVKAELINVIIYEVFRGRLECKYKTDLLNTLYRISPIEFIRAFKEEKKLLLAV